MATIWEILELDGPTNDERAIKSAYAKRLRAVRPEEDQTGFMALRDAFERARTYARIHAEEINTDKILENSGKPQRPDKNKSSEFDYKENYEPKDSPSAYFDDEADFSYSETEETTSGDKGEPDFQDIMREKVAALIRSPWTINSKEAWAALFALPELDAIDAESEFEGVLRTSLLALTGFFGQTGQEPKMKLKPETAAYIFNHMNWMDPTAFDHSVSHELQWLAEKLGIVTQDQPKEAELDNDYEDDDDDDGGGISWVVALLTVGLTTLLIYLTK